MKYFQKVTPASLTQVRLETVHESLNQLFFPLEETTEQFLLLHLINPHAKVNSKSLDLVVSKESPKNRTGGFQGKAQLKVCCVLCFYNPDSQILPYIEGNLVNLMLLSKT